MINCKICHSQSIIELNCLSGLKRSYDQCQSCGFVQMKPSEWLSQELEKNRYEHHQNTETEGYLNFLKPLLDLVTKNNNSGQKGLDYGSGPLPSGKEKSFLAEKLEQVGFEMSIFDPYFFSKEAELNGFDFITCTEVIEHVSDPMSFVRKMKLHLKINKSSIYLMTSLYPGIDLFETWSYRRDLTHISFFTSESLKILFEKNGFIMKIHSANLFEFNLKI